MTLSPSALAPPTTLQTALRRLAHADLRPVVDDDSAGLVALIGATFAEYPGCVLDLPGLDRDLLAPATAAADQGTWLWVVEHPLDGVIGCIGLGDVDSSATCELRRLYVDARHRRRGLARGLIEWVEAAATARGARTVELWTDTRFTDAHRLYEAAGYTLTGRQRELNDPSNTTELHMHRALGPG